MSDDRIEVQIGATTDELKAGMQQAQEVVKSAVAGMQASFAASGSAITDSVHQMQTGVKTLGEGISTALTGGGANNLVQAWQQELDRMRLAGVEFQTTELAQERDFWADKLRTGQTATAQELAGLKAAARQEQLDRLEAEREFWRQKLALCQAGSQTYAEVERKLATYDSQIAKGRLQLDIQAIKDRLAANQAEIADQAKLIENKTRLRELDLKLQQEDLHHQAKMGEISKTEELVQYKDLLAAKQKADLSDAALRANLYKGDEQKYKEHLNNLVVLQKKQALELNKIDDQIAEAEQSSWGNAWNSMTRTMGSSLTQIIQGAKGMVDVLTRLFQDILDAFVKMLSDMLVKWLATTAIMQSVGGFLGGLFHGGGQVAHGGALVMHGGGPIFAHTGLAPDEVPIIAQRGEWILSRAAARSLSGYGPDVFNRLNAGQLPVAAGGGGAQQLISQLSINVLTPDGRTLLRQNKSLLYDLANQGIARGEINVNARR
jgi:hypothetical protein